MSTQAIIGGAIAVSAAVIAVLLTQSDVVIPSGIKLALICAQTGLTVLAVRFNLNPPA